MLSRLFSVSALAIVMLAPSAWAQEKKSDSAKKSAGPAVLVRVQSINELLKTADYVRTLLPEAAGEQFKQGIDAARAFIDDKKGLEGIDVTNPIGAYVTFGQEFDGTPPVVVLVPIADQ